MSKLVNLITGLIGFGLICRVHHWFVTFHFNRFRRVYGRFAVHVHCDLCFGFGAL